MSNKILKEDGYALLKEDGYALLKEFASRNQLRKAFPDRDVFLQNFDRLPREDNYERPTYGEHNR